MVFSLARVPGNALLQSCRGVPVFSVSQVRGMASKERKRRNAEREAQAEVMARLRKEAESLTPADVAPVGQKLPITVREGDAVPEIRPDEEYPEWLWTIGDDKSLDMLQKKSLDSLSMPDQERLLKLANRVVIKQNNVKRAK